MAVEELAIPAAVLPAQHARQAVVDLDDLLQVGEQPPTPGAPPTLPPEQECPARGQLGMAAQPTRPVDHVAAKGTGVAFDLTVPADGRVGVAHQRRPVRRPEGKCQNSVLDRPTRGKPWRKWGAALQIAPLCGRHSA